MSDEQSTEVRVVLNTAPSIEVAERIAGALVEERLAACATVVPGVVSIYRWEGALRREGEVLVVLKTTGERVKSLRSRLVELHPYDVPEVLALSVQAGHEPYLAWVRDEVRRPT
jgi:periplasmic divalent cation tolerance protein